MYDVVDIEQFDLWFYVCFVCKDQECVDYCFYVLFGVLDVLQVVMQVWSYFCIVQGYVVGDVDYGQWCVQFVIGIVGEVVFVCYMCIDLCGQ